MGFPAFLKYWNDTNIFSFIGLPRLFVMEKMGSVSGKKLHIRRIDLIKLNVVHLTS